jgi:hypothetical protein
MSHLLPNLSMLTMTTPTAMRHDDDDDERRGRRLDDRGRGDRGARSRSRSSSPEAVRVPADIPAALIRLIKNSTNNFRFVRKDDRSGWAFEYFHTFASTRLWLIGHLVREHGFEYSRVAQSDDAAFDTVYVQRPGSRPLPPAVVAAIEERQRLRDADAAEMAGVDAERDRQARAKSELRGDLDEAGRARVRAEEAARAVIVRRKAKMYRLAEQGLDTVDPADVAWYDANYAPPFALKWNRDQLQKYTYAIARLLPRLPPTTTTIMAKLDEWPMAALAEVILESVANAADVIVTAVGAHSLNVTQTAYVEFDIPLPMLRGGMLQAFVRTTPAGTRAAADNKTRNAVTWTVYAAGADVDVANAALRAKNYGGQAGQAGGNIQVNSLNTLYVVLNALWRHLTRRDAHAWRLRPVARRNMNVTVAPLPAPPVVPAPAPPIPRDPDGWSIPKRFR